MDDKEKQMTFAYMAQSILNQDKLLNVLCKDDPEIKPYSKNSNMIARYFINKNNEIVKKDNTQKPENNVNEEN